MSTSLVPNEEFIKAQVINWTLREARRRVRVPFGVAYGSDKELVRKAGLEAAEEVEWTLKGMPGPHTAGVADQIRRQCAGIRTRRPGSPMRPVSRPARVIADYNWAIHTALEKYELEIPFPQRDLHLKSATGLNVTVETRSDKSNKAKIRFGYGLGRLFFRFDDAAVQQLFRNLHRVERGALA